MKHFTAETAKIIQFQDIRLIYFIEAKAIALDNRLRKNCFDLFRVCPPQEALAGGRSWYSIDQV